MTALNDYTRVASSILANKNMAAQNLQTQKLNTDAQMQGQRIGSEEKMQGQRLSAEETLQGKRIDAANALTGLQHTNEIAKMAEADKFKAAEQNRTTGAAALLAGGNEAVAANMINNQPGLPGDPRGLNIPLKTNQQDQFQFVTRDAPVGTNQPAAIFAGNKQTGQLHQVGDAAAALAGTANQQQQKQQPAAQQSTREAADAFSNVYQANPQRLQEDTAFAAAQIGTVYKTDEEQLSYLNSVRKTNPTLFQALKQRLGQQQPAAR